MSKFIVYSASGEILRTGECPREALSLQAQEGEFLMEGEASCAEDSVNPKNQKIIKKGRVAPITSPQKAGVHLPKLSAETLLNLLWQAMDAGTFPKAEPFYSVLKAQNK